MNPLLQNLLNDAARLTRAGDLRAATAAIQAALGRTPTRPAAPASTEDALVIDVQARELPDVPSDATEPQPMTPGPAAPAAEATTGSFVHGSHTGAAGTREYKLYVPAHDGSPPLPLVVMLHGCTQDPDDFAIGTGMNDAALAQGFFVLYPAQAQSANAQRCWNWFKHNHQQRDRGEPSLLAGMTRAVMKQHPIDPQRVYVAGLSAGGAMAAILGDTYPDLFAAVGVHSGLATGAASDLGSAFAAMQGGAATTPMSTGLAGLPGLRVAAAEQRQPTRCAGMRPTIVFHGDRDPTVHPLNGEHVVAACLGSAADAMKSDVRADDREHVQAGNGHAYTRQSHRDAEGRVVAEHWLIHGAGHAWAGGRTGGSFTDPQGPDATQEMLRFFFTHRHSASSEEN